MTAGEERRLLLLAAERRVSVPRLLVESALSGGAGAAAARDALAGELFAISRLLGKVGVNVNQMARATNSTHRLEPGLSAALDAVGRVCARIERALDEVEGRRVS